MLEKIKAILFQKYPQTDCRWIFLSAFGPDNKILVSTWVLYADKSIEDALDTIYHGVVEKKEGIQTIVIDVVTETREIMDLSEIQELSVKEYGVAIVEWKKSWVILPDTKWVENFSQWIQLVNQKNWLSGNAKIFVFKTDRIIVS